MNKIALSVLIILIIVGVSYFAYNYFYFGTLNVYLQDQPASVKIYFTISSIMVYRVNGSWITITNNNITILLSPNMTFLASSRIPVGEYNEIFLLISKATVNIGNLNITAKLPSEVFKIHIINGLKMDPASTHSILISLPTITYSNGNIIINPSVTAKVIS